MPAADCFLFRSVAPAASDQVTGDVFRAACAMSCVFALLLRMVV